MSDTTHSSLRREAWFAICFSIVFALSAVALTTFVRVTSGVPLTGEVIAADSVVEVRHTTGGVIADVLVEEGDNVRAGDPLIFLDESTMQFAIDGATSNVAFATALVARLEAQQAGTDVQLPITSSSNQTFSADLTEAAASEQALLAGLRAGAATQTTALATQRNAALAASAAINSDLAALSQRSERLQQALLAITDDQLESAAVRAELQQELSGVMSTKAELQAQSLSLQGNVTELNRQLANVAHDLQLQASLELPGAREALVVAQARLDELLAQEESLTLKAPIAGIVLDMSVSSTGEVATPGAVLMTLAPEGGAFAVSVRIPAASLPLIADKTDVRVQIANLPEVQLVGRLEQIAPSASVDPLSQISYFDARVSVPEFADSSFPSADLITAGSPVTVTIEGDSRTIWEYLTAPMAAQFEHVFREP